uniref:C-type lectin domain-containing protein n=1 Tax=Laticauda laticaudata TaxID=8630 RepID=A0A8C5SDW4_LATLA
MRLSARPCIPTMLTFLLLLQLAFKVSLQEGIAANGGYPRTKIATEGCDLELQCKELRIQVNTIMNIIKVLLGPDRTVVGHKIFKMEEHQGTFQRGKIGCDDNLALPRNNEENQALEDLLQKPGQKAILGITYNTAENEFEDLNGHPVQFFSWAPGEPNILGEKKCVTINTEGKWHVEDCLYERTIICEVDI